MNLWDLSNLTYIIIFCCTVTPFYILHFFLSDNSCVLFGISLLTIIKRHFLIRNIFTWKIKFDGISENGYITLMRYRLDTFAIECGS